MDEIEIDGILSIGAVRDNAFTLVQVVPTDLGEEKENRLSKQIYKACCCTRNAGRSPCYKPLYLNPLALEKSPSTSQLSLHSASDCDKTLSLIGFNAKNKTHLCAHSGNNPTNPFTK